MTRVNYIQNSLAVIASNYAVPPFDLTISLRTKGERLWDVISTVRQI